MKREQAIVREIASMISVVACCHIAKLCAHAARDFRSQQKNVKTQRDGFFTAKPFLAFAPKMNS